MPETTLRCIQHLRRRSPHVQISVEVEKPGRPGLEELAAEADVVFYSRSWAEVSPINGSWAAPAAAEVVGGDDDDGADRVGVLMQNAGPGLPRRGAVPKSPVGGGPNSVGHTIPFMNDRLPLSRKSSGRRWRRRRRRRDESRLMRVVVVVLLTFSVVG